MSGSGADAGASKDAADRARSHEASQADQTGQRGQEGAIRLKKLRGDHPLALSATAFPTILRVLTPAASQQYGSTALGADLKTAAPSV